MITQDRGAGQASAFEPHFPCRITRITINPTIVRAIPATYSLAAKSVNRDAGTLTNRTVAATNTMVIARPIQIVRTRVFWGFTIVAYSEMSVTANLDSNIFRAKSSIRPVACPPPMRSEIERLTRQK
jgi:hypothetical protein